MKTYFLIQALDFHFNWNRFESMAVKGKIGLKAKNLGRNGGVKD